MGFHEAYLGYADLVHHAAQPLNHKEVASFLKEIIGI